jgi:hypothetical protein
MDLKISPRRITRTLTLIVLFLTCASIAAMSADAIWGHQGLLKFLRIFKANSDHTAGTWYSSLTLLLCSSLLGIIAAAKKRYGDRYTRHWGVLSIIFLLLSVDEVAKIHETIGTMFWTLVKSADLIPRSFMKYPSVYFWIVPGAVFVLIVLLGYLRFLAHLPKKTLLLFLVAGALFVGGALGMEILEARQVSYFDETKVAYVSNVPYNPEEIWLAVQTPVEEALEMSSIIVFIYALLSYISSHVKEVTLQIRS